MTDRELAIAFFDRLKERGFKLNFNYEAYSKSLEDYPKEELPLVIELLNAEGESFCEFDFHADGKFYRIAGFTSGYWQDEVDWCKY